MKRHILTILVIVFITPVFGQNQLRQLLTGENGVTRQLTVLADSQQVTFNFRNARSTFGLDASSNLLLINTETDQLGITHYRYSQTYKGIPVENAMYIAHTKGGILMAAGGAIVSDFTLPAKTAIAAAITPQRAVDAALRYVNANQYAWQDSSFEHQLKTIKGSSATYYPSTTTVWYSGEAEINPALLRLAFKVDVYSLKPFDRKFIYVDAQNGKILGMKAEILQTDVTGGVATFYSGLQNIHSDLNGPSSFRMRDYTKGNGIITLNGLSSYADYLSNSALWTDLAGSNRWALDVHYGVSATWDFYKNNFNRNSIDNNNYALTSYVNDPYIAQMGGSNAAWMSADKLMRFGNLPNGNGVVAIDITAHELTHGVTQFTSNLTYSNEPGAINESMSDIMGKSVQFYSKPTDVNWQISNDMSWYIRDMSNPNSKGNPDTYKGLYWHYDASDYYGIHANSSVGNFMFYLLVTGGNGTNDLGNTYTVSGIGLAKADQILYRTNTTYLTSISQYADWRTVCIQAATDLFGSASNEVAQVKNAWQAVGIGVAASACSVAPSGLSANNVTNTSVTLTWSAVPGAVSYTLQWGNSSLNTIAGITAPSYNLTGLVNGTSYKYQVATVCNNGSSGYSNPSFISTTNTLSASLNYRYYEGTYSSLPDFNTLTPTKTGTSANVDISVRTPGRNDNFAFVWEGAINISTPGVYTFETISDDGSALYFNSLYSFLSTPTVMNDGVHAATSATGTVNINAAGVYPIAITYFEKDGGEAMQVYWSGPGISRQPIPDAAFVSITAADNIAPSAPANLHTVSKAANSVSLDWDNSTDNVGVIAYDVFVGGVKTYSTAESQITADNLSANTTYVFAVKARDLAGNTSGLSNAVTETTNNSLSGLNYKYYEGNWNSLPDFNTLTPVKTGNSPNIDISVRPAGRNDSFAFVWQGYINITSPGSYTFETVSDDGSRFYFNSLFNPAAIPTVNNDGVHAAVAATGTVNIPVAGVYPVSITYFEKDGGEQMQVYWTGPGIGRQIIPNSAFAQSSSPPANNLTYKYYEGSWNSLPDFTKLTPVKTGSSSNVDISVRPPGRNDSFAFVWQGFIKMPAPGTYTFETLSDDGSRLYFNAIYDSLVNYTVNNDGVHGPTSATGQVFIAVAGVYPISISYFEKDGGEQMQVYWSGPGFARQLIPDSAFTNAQPAAGLNYKYYEGTWNNLPDFNKLIPVKTGISANVDISVRTPGRNDNFAFLWQGYITMNAPGNYYIETVSDDGSKLYLTVPYDSIATPIVNNDGIHSETSVTGVAYNAIAGVLPIAITYFDKVGAENMQLYWSGPGFSRRPIPNAAFRTLAALPANSNSPVINNNITVPSLADSLLSKQGKIRIEKVYPNPFTENIRIDFYNRSMTNDISTAIFDLNGRMVYQQHEGTFATGNNTIVMNIGKKNLAEGSYFVKVTVNGIIIKTVKLVRTKH